LESATQLRNVLNLNRQGGEYSVIASLPKNSTLLAVQAEEAGADAIMLNIEGDESGPQGHRGGYDLHDVYINDVLSTVSVPCGLCVGGARSITEEYWERIMSSSFSFVDMYAHQMPLFVLSDSRVKKLVAISTGYILEQVKGLSELDGVEALDVAVVHAQARGGPFTVLDFATTSLIAGLSAKPVLLRTQKRLGRGDVSRVVESGVKGLIVDPSALRGPDEAYREEILSLRPRREDTEQL
jgi:hypothetical protein